MNAVVSPITEPVLTTRVLLAPMAMSVRLHLRRLLRSVPGIEVVGQAFDASQIPTMAATAKANWVLADANANLLNTHDNTDSCGQLINCLIMHLPGKLPNSVSTNANIHRITRPLDLETEQPDGVFMKTLSQTLSTRTAISQSLATAGDPPPMPLPAFKRTVGGAGKLFFDVLAIGASTGGPDALTAVLQAIAHPIHVPIVITQHMGIGFTASLAQSIAKNTKLNACEVQDGDILHPNCVYLAPGGRHFEIELAGGLLIGRLSDGPAECFCKPSVDVMFRSLAKISGVRTLALVLTGMGQDGLVGAQLIKSKGGVILAQDEASSIVWGMPGAVAKAGLCEAVLPLQSIGESILKLLRKSR